MTPERSSGCREYRQTRSSGTKNHRAVPTASVCERMLAYGGKVESIETNGSVTRNKRPVSEPRSSVEANQISSESIRSKESA